MQNDTTQIPTMRIGLKAPVEFFEQLDRWRQMVKQREHMVRLPDRQAAIRFIVHHYLEAERAKAARRKRR
jgi:hypothetical protein